MEIPIVKVNEGKLRGIKDLNYNGVNFYAFRGIPYAKPPIGALRFKDPEPLEPWSGTKDATQYASKCAQINWFSRKIMGTDDCLYLNVYTTELNLKKLKAVIILIHGGNFSFGSGDDDINGPDFIVEKDVILVAINYRVGILGFLNLDDEQAPGNQGLKDQVMALKWVKRNIIKFGGDPDNVTIFGYSAGSASVHYLTLSPLAQGLFHKAILQSGVATNPWASVSVESMKDTAEKITAILGYKTKDAKELVEFLRKADVGDILKAEVSLFSWKNRLSISTFGPSIDSKSKTPFIEIPIEEAVNSGIKVPCIFGVTSHEAIMTLTELTEENLSEIDADEGKLLHPTVRNFLDQQKISFERIRKFYMADNKISLENIHRFVDLMSMTNFLINIYHIVKIQQQFLNVPTYLFKFDYYNKNTSMMQKILRTNLKGACHCEDVSYLFNMKVYKKKGIEPPKSGSIEHNIQQRFIELWTAFAKTGNPNNHQSHKLIPVEWKPIGNDPVEFNCLKISAELWLAKEMNPLYNLFNAC